MSTLLEVQGLGITFGGLRAVNDVSFCVSPGEIVSVIGPNGAGKTTLFNMISGVYRPGAGSVKLDGEDVTGLDPYLLARRGLSRTFQNLQIFQTMTVLENAIGLSTGQLVVLVVEVGCEAFGRALLAAAVELGLETRTYLVDTVNRAAPYYISAVAVAIGFKMGLFFIGVEGTYRVAALMAAAAGAAVSLPAVLHVPFILIVAVVSGAAWASIVASLWPRLWRWAFPTNGWAMRSISSCAPAQGLSMRRRNFLNGLCRTCPTSCSPR